MARCVVAHLPPTATGSRPAHVLLALEADLAPEERAAPWELGVQVAGAAAVAVSGIPSRGTIQALVRSE